MHYYFAKLGEAPGEALGDLGGTWGCTWGGIGVVLGDALGEALGKLNYQWYTIGTLEFLNHKICYSFCRKVIMHPFQL